jgi:hypothetical protein
MKRSFYLLMLALACLLMAAPTYAQTDMRVSFHASFPFNAGGMQMPAGDYVITADAGGHAYIFPEHSGRRAAILLTHLANLTEGRGRASVSFVERSGQYYLNTVNLTDGAVVGLGTGRLAR